MEKYIGQDIQNLQEREAFIKDNAESVESIGYIKPLTSSEIEKMKEQLTTATIDKSDTEEEKKSVVMEYNDKLKGLKKAIGTLVERLKSKGEYVNEPCYKIIDDDAKRAGFYNKEGMLVYQRAARQDELQPRLFKVNTLTSNKDKAKDKAKTGTDE